MKLNSKKFTIVFMTFFVAVLLLFGLFEAIIDPCFHYHAPLDSMSYSFIDERYVNDGIVRHFDYDAIITGTSMTENFKSSEMDELFGTNSIKVCFAGGHYREIDSNIRVALESNPNIKMVVRGLDINSIVLDKDAICNQLDNGEIVYPFYISDGNPLTDVEYLFNKDIFLEYTYHDFAITKAGEETTNFDDYAYWNDRDTSTIDLKQMASERIFGLKSDREDVKDLSDDDVRIATDNINQNIIETALKYPDVDFYYFLTPYSILWWDSKNQSGSLDYNLDAIELEMRMLVDVDNIHLFAFLDRDDIVCNLDYYIDEGHYTAQVNSEILRCMKSGENLITKENIDEYITNVREFYENYDYDKIYEIERDITVSDNAI